LLGQPGCVFTKKPKAMSDNFTENLVSKHSPAIEKVAEILCDLRELDIESIEHVLSLIGVAGPLMPEELKPAVDCLKNDLKLALFFAQQAKERDSSETFITSIEAILETPCPQ
jgi:hypothetical protein